MRRARGTVRTTMSLLVLVLVCSCVTAFDAPTARAASFRVECAESHVAMDDPIVFPGAPGAAHEHAFFGATATSATSTVAQLRAGATTCSAPHDTAAYWAPTLVVHGTRIRGRLTVWYERGGKRRAAAPPPGLKLLAGTARATAPQPLSVVSWQCVGASRYRQSVAVPACTRREQLAAWIRFPDCWDGHRLDSTDHRAHTSYAIRGTCDSDHPVELMRIVYRLQWPAHPSPAAVRLAGGMLSPVALHADFWNAWHQPNLQQLRWDCIEVTANCGLIRR